MIVIRLFKLQQLRQSDGSGRMHRSTDRCLDTLEIEAARRPAVAQNDPQQLFCMAGEFVYDRFGSFFSWADATASITGRSSQICVLTSTNC